MAPEAFLSTLSSAFQTARACSGPQTILIDPLAEGDRWNRLVMQFQNANVFHSSQWASLLADCYGYKPQYMAFSRGGLAAALPLVEVASWVNGRRGVSVPFADECPLLSNDALGPDAVIEAATAFGRRNRWRFLEVRGVRPVPGAAPAGRFVEHRLSLEKDEAQLWRQLGESHRRNIARAQRHGVEVEILTTRGALDAYFRLHCLTRRRHGSPPQPYRFFRLLHQHLIADGLGVILLARFEGSYVAGAVLLRFGHNAIYKFAASESAFQHVRPNNLILWRAIEHFRAAGATWLSLGRTDVANRGLVQFKRGWGGQENELLYHRVAITKPLPERAGGPCWPASGLIAALCRRTPMPLLRFAGAMMYPHLG